MTEIQLTQGQVALIDDEDYERVRLYNWNAHRRGGGVNKFYAETGHYESHKHLHRFVLNLSDQNIFVDHIDGNTLNNQKNNLRTCTQAQNNLNKKPYSNSPINGIKGVSFIRATNKWRAQIQANKKKVYIGVYDSYIEAALAYNNKSIELHGEFANINKI